MTPLLRGDLYKLRHKHSIIEPHGLDVLFHRKDLASSLHTVAMVITAIAMADCPV